MKIAYCLLQFPVLSQTFIVNEIVELLRLGHDVRIFSATQPDLHHVQPEVREYDLIARTNYLPVFATITRRLPEPSGLPDFFRDTFHATRTRTRIAEEVIGATAASYFARLAEQMGADVIHAHFHGSASALAALVARRAGLPFTLTCHALDIFVDPDPQGYAEAFRRGFRSHYDIQLQQTVSAGTDGSGRRQDCHCACLL